MALFRRAYRLDAYLTPLHFRNLGHLLLVLDLMYIYFTFSEYLTVGYSSELADRRLLDLLFTGAYAPAFWTMAAVGLVLPAILLVAPSVPSLRRLETVPLLRPRPLAAAVAGLAVALAIRPVIPQAGLGGDLAIWTTLRWAAVVLSLLFIAALLPRFQARPLASIVTASVLVNVGMWLKRYVIVIPTLKDPFLPIQFVPTEWADYQPTWVEWSITAAALAGFVLIYLLFSKVFPIISIWETREATGAEGAHAREEVSRAPAF